jgi:hypothetical protein
MPRAHVDFEVPSVVPERVIRAEDLLAAVMAFWWPRVAG